MGDSRCWGAAMVDGASFGEWRGEAPVELGQQASRPKAVQAHYDLSAAYLELRYGAIDHADRARTID